MIAYFSELLKSYFQYKPEENWETFRKPAGYKNINTSGYGIIK